MKAEFSGQYAELERWHWWFRGRQRILESVLRRQLDERASLSIASVGGGPIEGLGWLRSLAQPEGRIVGLDVDPSHGQRRCDGVDFVAGRLEAAPFISTSFDVVLALDVLEHLDDDVAGLTEAARLLKPRGLLVVTVPAFPSLWGRQDVVSHHRRRYTRQALRQAFRQARLPPPRVLYFNALLFPPIAAVRWTRRLLGLENRPRSDFEHTRPGVANEFLAAIFGAERVLVGRVPLPVGVSLMAITRSEPRA